MTSRTLPRCRRALRIAAVCVAGLAVVFASITLLRHRLVAAVAHHEIKNRGLQCDDITANVPLAMPPHEVRLAPMRCTMDEGAVRAIHFRTTVVVDLDGLQLGSVHTDAIDIDLRRRTHPEVQLNVLGNLMRIGGMDDAIVDLIFDAASVSLLDLPPVSSAYMNLTRAGHPVATLRDMRLGTRGGGLFITARSVELEGAVDLIGALRLDAFWVNAHRVQGSVTFLNDRHAEVTAAGLAGLRPEIQFALGTSATPSN